MKEQMIEELKKRIEGLEALKKRSDVDADYNQGKIDAFSEVLRAAQSESFALQQRND